MAVKVIVVISPDAVEHCERLAFHMSDGWELIGFPVENAAGEWVSFLKHEDSAKRLDLSSLREAIEVLEQRQKRLLQRVKILEETEADRDDYMPVDCHFVPLSRIDIVEEALREDQEKSK